MKNLKVSFICMIFILIILVANQSFASGFAASIGTEDFATETYEDGTNNMINTSSLVNTSKNYYLGLRFFTK